MVKLMLHHAILIGKKVNNRNPSNEATAIKPSSGKTFPFKSLPPSKRKVKNLSPLSSNAIYSCKLCDEKEHLLFICGKFKTK